MLEEICCHKIYCSDLPAKSKFCAFDGSDKIINSNSTVPREHVHNIFECYKDMMHICASGTFAHFILGHIYASLATKGLNKVGNASLRTEKGCGFYTKIKPFA